MKQHAVRKKIKITKIRYANEHLDNQQGNAQASEQKNIYYGAVVSGFIESSMERDRSLFTISAGAIGLLITLMSTVGPRFRYEIAIYIFSFLSFGLCIILLLKVFNLNKEYFKQLAKDEEPDDAKLGMYDKWIYRFFIIGICLFFAEGIITSINQLKSVEVKAMAKEEQKPKEFSVDGLSKLVPDSDKTAIKSVAGLANLKPQATKPDSNKPSESDKKSDKK